MTSALFYFLAAVMLVSAGGIVACRNLIHSALSMTVCFIAAAGLYTLLDADFLAAVQIMVYAGTVAILIVLGIMITRRVSMEFTNLPQRRFIVRASLLAGVLAALLCAVVLYFAPQIDAPGYAASGSTAAAIAELMLSRCMLAFETAAVLLLAAMIGAIVLAKGAGEE